MSEETEKNNLKAKIAELCPDNETGEISPKDLRDSLGMIIDLMVTQKDLEKIKRG